MTSPTKAAGSTTKRGHAINGDLFELRHDALDLHVPFTSFVDVSFRGVTHQVLVAADKHAFSFANVTGEFTVGDYAGFILEVLDSVETQASHRYQAIVTTPHGLLSTHSYASPSVLMSFVGALRPTDTMLGVVLEPDDECEYTSAPRVALTLPIGVVEVTPLTAEVIDRLPTWKGSPVQRGELYGGQFTDDAPYLTLVTDTCRVLALPGPGISGDVAATAMAAFEAEWQA